jgi:Flp pilus assembly pilin Flp
MKTYQRFLADDRGLETVEYAIITGLIVTGLVAVVVAIGTWIKGKFDATKTEVGA